MDSLICSGCFRVIMLTRGRGHEALRRGRWSCPGAEYFLTFCTKDRRCGLAHPGLLDVLGVSMQQLSADRVWSVRTAVIMPDHIHLLVALRSEDTLSEAVRLFKGRSSVVLRGAELQWQRGYFDHRMRDGEDRLPVFRYIYLNPYRAGLVDIGRRWPGYFCADEDWE